MVHTYHNHTDLPGTLPLFPLAGVLLLPRGTLPLNVFEPRYLEMVDRALATDRLIGVIQPADRGVPDRHASVGPKPGSQAVIGHGFHPNDLEHAPRPGFALGVILQIGGDVGTAGGDLFQGDEGRACGQPGAEWCGVEDHIGEDLARAVHLGVRDGARRQFAQLQGKGRLEQGGKPRRRRQD